MTEKKRGSVTFLDVLGWKGIANRNKNAISTLLGMIKDSQNHITEILEKEILGNGEGNVFKKLEVKLLSISDTIVLITYGDPDPTLLFHGGITAYIVSKSIQLGIPVRGATGYGDFSIEENILEGPVVDEVASWYEVTDWIGVIQLPSASLEVEDYTNYLIEIDEKKSKRDHVFISYPVPLKRAPKMKLLSSNWPYYIENINELARDLKKLSPIYPEVAAKIINTLEYYKYIKSLKGD